MRWKPYVFALVLSVGLGHVRLAVAQQQFTVGVQNFKEYLPYSQYEQGEYSGFSRRLLDLFASTRGYTFVYAAYPVKRLYRVFLEEGVDLKYPDNPYWSADLKQGKAITYSQPVVEYIDGVLVKPERKGQGVAAIHILGVIRGFTPFTYMKLIQAGTIRTAENRHYEGLLRQVLTGRVDGAYVNIAVSRYYLAKYFHDANVLVFDPDLPHTRSQRHLSSIKYPKIIEEFNEFLKRHKKVVDSLKKEYRVEEGIR